MLLEHDSLNHRHLVDAGLPALLHKYIAERLHRGPNDYPAEDTCNVLAVALFWHMTSQGVCFERSHSTSVDLTLFPSDALNGESNNNGNKVIDILLSLTFAWFRVRPLHSLLHSARTSGSSDEGSGNNDKGKQYTSSPPFPYLPLNIPVLDLCATAISHPDTPFTQDPCP